MEECRMQMQVAEKKKGRPKADKFTYIEHQLALLPDRFASGSRTLQEVEELAIWEYALKKLTIRQWLLVELLYFQRKSKTEVMFRMGWKDSNFRFHKFSVLRRLDGIINRTREEKEEEREEKKDCWIFTMQNGRWYFVNKN